MSRFSEYDEQTGEYTEGFIGEAACPICGCPMLAKYTQEGHFIEIVGRCPECGGTE